MCNTATSSISSSTALSFHLPILFYQVNSRLPSLPRPALLPFPPLSSLPLSLQSQVFSILF